MKITAHVSHIRKILRIITDGVKIFGKLNYPPQFIPSNIFPHTVVIALLMTIGTIFHRKGCDLSIYKE